MHNTNTTVSIILPATDETDALKETVSAVTNLVGDMYRLHFLIITSPRLTTEECRGAIADIERAAQQPTVTIEHIEQHTPGLGGALQDSFAFLKGEYTVLMASDLETDPQTLPALLELVRDGADISVASRWQRGVRFKGYHPGKLILNFFFQQLLRVLYLTTLSDITYAYRVYRTPILTAFAWQETRHPFLLECLLKPLRAGYTVREVSTTWRVRSEGVSHGTALDTLSYIKTALRIRLLPKKLLYSAHE